MKPNLEHVGLRRADAIAAVDRVIRYVRMNPEADGFSSNKVNGFAKANWEEIPAPKEP
jgi:hypothetical protein